MPWFAWRHFIISTDREDGFLKDSEWRQAVHTVGNIWSKTLLFPDRKDGFWKIQNDDEQYMLLEIFDQIWWCNFFYRVNLANFDCNLFFSWIGILIVQLTGFQLPPSALLRAIGEWTDRSLTRRNCIFIFGNKKHLKILFGGCCFGNYLLYLMFFQKSKSLCSCRTSALEPFSGSIILCKCDVPKALLPDTPHLRQ